MDKNIDNLLDDLFDAIFEGNVNRVAEILKSGVDVNRVPMDRQWPAIFVAVEQENIEAIKLLLENGADLNIQDKSGFTPLHLAIDIEADGAYQLEKEPMMIISRFLIETGADTSATDNRGNTPLDIAIEYEYKEAIDVLSAGLRA